jgi:prepilin-type processing-associated H-X9-DG protein
MAIALTCPSCARELKVKDELAGRKIKCPGCATILVVPGTKAESETRITAKKPSPVPAAADDADDTEDVERPKNKKKKKAAGNRGLIIGGAIAGAVVIVIVVLVIMLAGGGNAKDKGVQRKVEPPPKKAEQPVVQVEEPEIEKKAPVGGLGRTKEVTEIQNSLRQLGIAYKQFEVVENRGPKDQRELGPYYQNINPINEALKNKWITFIWRVPRQALAENGDSNTVLAYETDADRQGIRMVLFGDGHVEGMNEEDFKKAPKAKGR